MKAVRAIFFNCTLAILTACASSVPEPLPNLQSAPEPPNGPSHDDNHMEILAVSGGGHRAAHYTIGMLLALDNLPISSPQAASATSPNPTILGEIDVVSSVSGGSYGIAVYLASYVNEACRSGKIADGQALNLLKSNRERLHNMASKWWPDFVVPAINPQYWTDDRRNIDRLESEYFSKLIAIDNCEGKLLTTGHLNRRGSLHVPFRHIVNATNSESGKIFSFFDDPSFETTYQKIKCIYWRGAAKKVHYDKIPYSLALASSAAFPPIVTDGIFGDAADCANGSYLRLTDGGQADDNGIDVALKHASKWLEKGGEKAFILSLDSLVDSTDEWTASKSNKNIFSIAIERNADLPRYSKKRQEKQELDTICRNSPTKWETFAHDKAIFGTYVGFSRTRLNTNLSAPPELDCDESDNGKAILRLVENDNSGLRFAENADKGHVSDISTFSNFDGLTIEQKLSGVAEGYFQTVRKFLDVQLVSDDVLLRRAEAVAFDLYCSAEDSFWFRSRCKNYFSENQAALSQCFKLRDGIVTKIEGAACSFEIFEISGSAKSLVAFNDRHEEEKSVNIEKAQDLLVSIMVDDLSKKTTDSMKKVSKFAGTLVSEFEAARTKLIEEVYHQHVVTIDKLIPLTIVDPKDVRAFERLSERMVAEIDTARNFVNNRTYIEKRIDDIKVALTEVSDEDSSWNLEIEKFQSSARNICNYSSIDKRIGLSVDLESDCPEHPASAIESDVLDLVDVSALEALWNFLTNEAERFDRIADALERIESDLAVVRKSLEVPTPGNASSSYEIEGLVTSIRKHSKDLDELCASSGEFKSEVKNIQNTLLESELRHIVVSRRYQVFDKSRYSITGSGLEVEECRFRRSAVELRGDLANFNAAPVATAIGLAASQAENFRELFEFSEETANRQLPPVSRVMKIHKRADALTKVLNLTLADRIEIEKKLISEPYEDYYYPKLHDVPVERKTDLFQMSLIGVDVTQEQVMELVCEAATLDPDCNLEDGILDGVRLHESLGQYVEKSSNASKRWAADFSKASAMLASCVAYMAYGGGRPEIDRANDCGWKNDEETDPVTTSSELTWVHKVDDFRRAQFMFESMKPNLKTREKCSVADYMNYQLSSKVYGKPELREILAAMGDGRPNLRLPPQGSTCRPTGRL